MNRLTRLSSVLALLLPGFSAQALTITLTDPTPTYVAMTGPCGSPYGVWTGCGSRAYLDYGSTVGANTYSTNPGTFQLYTVGEETFRTGFNDWVTANPGWTLDVKGPIDKLNMRISQFDAVAFPSVGGMRINVNVSTDAGYNGPALDSLYWTQSLLINYRPGENGFPFYNTLDEHTFNGLTCGAGTGRVCGPLYPYQYTDYSFFDGPQGYYPSASFRAIAMLTAVDRTNKVLTLYEGGVNYGFDVFVVPEPGTWVLMGSGVALLIAFRRRRA